MARYGFERLVAEPPDPNLTACVVVPAKNEEELLPSALHALAEQKTLASAPLPHNAYEVLLLINNSTDRSAHVARSFQRLYPSFRLHVIEREFKDKNAHIGCARRLLMDEACARLEAAGISNGGILSTDADTRVAPNWICRNLEELANGADVVGGRIVVLPCEQASLDSRTQALYRYDHLYARLVCWVENRCDPEAHDPWPRHPHHFGASLAIRPAAYRSAGHLPPRRFLEDLALYDALLRRDLRIRHSNRVRVHTSARVKGRIRFGLSRQLSNWQAGGTPAHRVRVESALFLEHLFQTRNRLRQIWEALRRESEPPPRFVQEVSPALGMPARGLLDQASRARYFGLLLHELRFYENCRAQWPDRVRLARLTDTVERLRAAFEADRHARAERIPVLIHARGVLRPLAKALRQTAIADRSRSGEL